MSDAGELAREELFREYAAALREFVAGAGEAALTRAYMLGRRAASAGIGLLDMAMVHHEAPSCLDDAGALQVAGRLSLAAQFQAEVLSPFEMTLRAYQDNVRLLGLNETLGAQDSAIDRSREQLRLILDATTAIIYLKDADGRYLFVNRAFQHVFGRSREEVIGRTDSEVMPAELAETLLATDRRVLAERRPTELEETISEANGRHTFLSLKFPLLDESGAAYGLCCVATDITERKQRDQALRRAVEAAEAANRELESFSFSVAHDLRAPLRVIDGFGLALLEDCGDSLNEQGGRYLRSMRESANHMALLIDGLLALARLARGTLRRGRVDLSTLCRGVADGLRRGEPARRVEFTIRDDLIVDGDGNLLRAVLDNLIGNAWKFTAKVPIARIEFGAQLDSAPAVYFVRDNGAGFDMAHASKLFGPFQRLHKASDFEGTGIGLATVQRIVRRHGGRVWAEAAVDAGATFYFTLEEGQADGPVAPPRPGQNRT